MSGKVTRRDFMTQVALLVGSKTALLRCARELRRPQQASGFR